MKAPSSEGPLGLALPNLFLVAVISWGIFGVNSGLRSPKTEMSPVGTLGSSNTSSPNTFASRHWEDPLIAPQSLSKKEDQSPSIESDLLKTSEEWARLYTLHQWNFSDRKSAVLNALSENPKVKTQQQASEPEDDVTKRWKRVTRTLFKSANKGQPFKFIIVGLDGSSGVTASENRIRKRSAITASILQNGSWQEATPGHLQRLSCTIPNLAEDSSEPKDPVTIPITVQHFYEHTWASLERPRNDLIVVYLNENQLLRHPAYFLTGLCCSLGYGFSTESNAKIETTSDLFKIAGSMKNVDFNFIGFNESDKLVTLFQSFHEIRPQKNSTNGANPPSSISKSISSSCNKLIKTLKIISPSSTVSATELQKRLGWLNHPTPEEIPKIQSKGSGLNLNLVYRQDSPFKDRSLFVHRLSTPDSLMAKLVAKELCSRGLRWTPAEDTHSAESKEQSGRILLLSGISSLYSRVQAHEIERATNARVDIFTYLRGLDGVSKTPPKSDPSQEKGTSTIRAEGNSQFDYLERLVAEIKEIENRVQAENHRWKYDAFGVIGIDAHDRLLILDALQQSFPNRLFFTFGVDARFWQMGNHRRKNNLLMFSSFSLNPVLKISNPDQDETRSKKRFPPFRDDTQTATYDAVQFCLLGVEKDSESKQNLFSQPKGHVHEITRHGISLLDKCYWADPDQNGIKSWVWQNRWGKETSSAFQNSPTDIRPRNKLTKSELGIIIVIIITLIIGLALRPILQVFAQMRETALRFDRRKVQQDSATNKLPLKRHSPWRMILRKFAQAVLELIKPPTRKQSIKSPNKARRFVAIGQHFANIFWSILTLRYQFFRRCLLHFTYLASTLIILILIVSQLIKLTKGLPGGEETISFFSGISSWPSTLLLGCSASVYLYWIWLAGFNIRKNLLINLARFPFPSCSDWLKKLVNHTFNLKQASKSKGLTLDGFVVCPNKHYFCGRMARYIEFGRQRRRFRICVIGSLLGAFLIYLIYSYFLKEETPQFGIRGPYSKFSYELMKAISMGTLVVLLAYVSHSHYLFYKVCFNLLKTLRVKKWRAATRAEKHIEERAIPDDDAPHFRRNYLMGPINPIERIDLPHMVKEFVNSTSESEQESSTEEPNDSLEIRGPGFWETPIIEFGVSRYRCLNRLLFFPFLALFWQLAVQNRIFDNFHVAQFEIIFYSLTFLFLILTSVLMQSKMRKCVDEAISRVGFVKATYIGKAPDEVSEFLDAELTRLKSCQNAVNHSLLNSPLVRAIALPLGGTGLLQGMEYFSHFLTP